jgi:sporulation protein YlmC with PRC-barrel domain
MLVKYLLAGVAGSAMLASVAFAQAPTATSDNTKMAPAAASDTSSQFQGHWRASKVVGLNVYNDKNESVGSINEILMDKSGNIQAVVLGVGGILGVGEHLVAVPFDKIMFVNEPVAYTGTAGATNKTTTSTTTTGTAATTTAPASTSTSKSGYPDHAVYNATKDELKAMPEFKYPQ